MISEEHDKTKVRVLYTCLMRSLFSQVDKKKKSHQEMDVRAAHFFWLYFLLLLDMSERLETMCNTRGLGSK